MPVTVKKGTGKRAKMSSRCAIKRDSTRQLAATLTSEAAGGNMESRHSLRARQRLLCARNSANITHRHPRSSEDGACNDQDNPRACPASVYLHAGLWGEESAGRDTRMVSDDPREPA
jgi:hypothetical protein